MDARFNVDDLTIADESTSSAAADDAIFTTPLVESGWELFENCRIASSMGALIGPSGTGKSWTLKAIAARYEKAQLPGTAHIHKCCQTAGPTSGIRALMVGLGIGGAVTRNRSGAGLSYMLKLAQKEMAQRGISGVLFDDADYLCAESMQGIVNLFDSLNDLGSPVAMLFSGVKDASEWLDILPAAQTRTLFVEHSEPMNLALTAGILRKAGEPLTTLIDSFKAKDKDARAIVRAIHRHTGGNWRRLQFFCDLALAKTSAPLTSEKVEAVLAQMRQ